MATPRKQRGNDRPKRPRATTPEARENQLVSLAYDLAEEQLANGTAPAMVTVHFLKLKTAETKLKEEKLRKENLLLEARTEALGSQKNAEILYGEVIKAIRMYQGFGGETEEEDEDV